MEKEIKQDGGSGRGGGPVLLSFLAGGILGAGVALLAASKHGKGMRSRIRELGDEAKQKAEDYVEKVKTSAASAMEHGKEILEEQKSVFDRVVDAGKEILEQQKAVISHAADAARVKGK